MRSTPSWAAIPMMLVVVSLTLTSCSRDPERAKAKYLATGKKYMTKGQYGDAAIEFRNALRLDPRFVDAYYQLAQATLAQHDWRSAYAALEKTIELDPQRLDARLDRGRLYLAARQFDKAEEEADFVLKEDSRNPGAYQLLGESMIGERKPDEALAALTKVTELLPKSSRAYLDLALFEIGLNHKAEAEQHLKTAVSADPKSTLPYKDLADFYRLQHQQVEAEQTLQEGIAQNPEATALYIEFASTLMSAGKKDDTEAVLDKLRKKLPHSSEAAIAIGDFYFQRKVTDAALTEYRRGLSISPKNLDIKKRMQDLYLETNQTKLATDLDVELMKAAPKDVAVRIDHSRLMMAQGKAGEAANDLQRIVADAADSAQAHYFLAMAYWQNNELGQARTALQDTLKVSPGLTTALQALVRLSLALNDTLNAQVYAQELVQRLPADSISRELLAGVLAQQGQLAQAEAQNISAKQLAPNNPTVHIGLGQIYTAEKKLPEAQKEFESALQLEPHNAMALWQLANCLINQKQTSAGVMLVKQYVNDNPNDQNGHLILGLLNSQQKSYDSAKSEFDRAVQIDPKNIQAYMQLGKLAAQQGQRDLAIASYQKAADLQPRSAPLATVLGNEYLEKGDIPSAQKYYGQALQSDPNFAAANANMAWIDAQQGKNLDIALSMAQKAKSLMPETPSITDTLAWVYYKRGNYAGAVPLLEDCVKKSPDSGEFHYHLGMALLATGSNIDGKSEISTALRMKLDADDAQKARQAIAQLN